MAVLAHPDQLPADEVSPPFGDAEECAVGGADVPGVAFMLAPGTGSAVAVLAVLGDIHAYMITQLAVEITCLRDGKNPPIHHAQGGRHPGVVSSLSVPPLSGVSPGGSSEV